MRIKDRLWNARGVSVLDSEGRDDDDDEERERFDLLRGRKKCDFLKKEETKTILQYNAIPSV